MDDRLVRPETRDEVVGGRRLLAVPAGAPHGDSHCHLDGEAFFHVRPGYVASTDLLTRVDLGSDFASDTSVRKEGVDPRTGARYLEEIVFEVVHEQSTREIEGRAERLIACGVRRVFAIFVKRREVAEWVPDARAFRPLAPDAFIDDPCLIRPLPVRALLDRAEGRAAVARVLVEERHPVIEEVRQQGRRDGLRTGLERLCLALDIALGAERRAALAALDATALEDLADRLARERRWPS